MAAPSPRIGQPQIHGAFALTDHNGRAVSNRSYGDKLLLMFFGFTHCRRVCPRKLAELSEALAGLGDRAEAIQPLYITVDPERDTPDVMRTYLASYPRFTGLTGSPAQIDEVRQRFRVFARRVAAPDETGAYDVPHTAVTYLVDGDGRCRSHFLDGMPVPELIGALRQLL